VKSVRRVRVTERDQRVARVIAGGLKLMARPGEEARFEAIAKDLLDIDLAYCMEAEEWEEKNGVPWDSGAGIRVLAERGDRQALAMLRRSEARATASASRRRGRAR